jgi:23S rRNA (cytidine1920-2'-O)/16S rRNA (cytidine1409-2'-O)-methyltransferase
MPKKERLDKLLVERGLAPSRERAQRFILAGLVTVEGALADKAGALFSCESEISIQEDLCPYVSRGGLKLVAALDAFQIDPKGRFCLDAGSSTGGFTDVLLQRGARRVAAVDVGKGQLDWKLRNDSRVVVIEGENIRYLSREKFVQAAGDEVPDFAVVDLSFISVIKVLEAVRSLMAEEAEWAILVKPQFEAGKGQVGKGGIVRDPAVHREVLQSVWDEANEMGLGPQGVIPSPIKGQKGNREFFLYLRPGMVPADRDESISEAMAGEVPAS